MSSDGEHIFTKLEKTIGKSDVIHYREHGDPLWFWSPVPQILSSGPARSSTEFCNMTSQFLTPDNVNI